MKIQPRLWYPNRLQRLICAGAIACMAWCNPVPAKAQAVFPQATAAARAEQRQQQEQEIYPENYDLSRYPVTPDNEERWRDLLWTTAVIEPQVAYVGDAIARIISFGNQSALNDTQHRTVELALQVGTQLYLSNPSGYAQIGQQLAQTLEHSPQAEWVAMALSALVKAGASAEQRQQWSDRVRQRFPQWSNDVYLYTTLRDVALLDNPVPMPPLADLLHWTIAPGQPQMYVLCPGDRRLLCQAVLKDGTGEFVRQEDGRLWSVSLLLRSLHNLSWNFTRGETPQGIYRIQGIRQPDTTTFRAYGQFPRVDLYVPYEAGVQVFIPGNSNPWANGVADYQTLLPPSWRAYFPIQQAYWAGKGGRNLFRIHGSGEATTFFTNNRAIPTTADWNPTLGCLSALELYDDGGLLLNADMPQILNTLMQASGQSFTGYLIVVDVPDHARSLLSLDELEAAIAQLH